MSCNYKWDLFDMRFSCGKNQPSKPSKFEVIEALTSMCLTKEDNRKALG